MSASKTFDRRATVLISTKRGGALVGGKRGDPLPHLVNLPALPFDPTTGEAQDGGGASAPVVLWQTLVQSNDVLLGDVVTRADSTKEYRVRAALMTESFGADRTPYTLLTLEELTQ